MYHLFAYNSYPKGGMGDYRGCFPSSCWDF